MGRDDRAGTRPRDAGHVPFGVLPPARRHRSRARYHLQQCRQAILDLMVGDSSFGCEPQDRRLHRLPPRSGCQPFGVGTAPSSMI